MKRVLVVEDDQAIRDNILDLLEAEGFAAGGAENGLVGVRWAREHPPDLIICDIMMPDLDGYGVLEELRRDAVTATIPFIFLTAKAEKSDLRRGMELGADDYLTKPFTRTELLNAIETRLAKQAAVIQKFQKKLDDLRSSITLSLPHELRTPLNGMLAGSSMLKDDLESLDRNDISAMAAIMYESAERLNRLILNYLLYAELELLMKDADVALALRKTRTDSVRTVIAKTAARVAQRAQREADLDVALEDAAVQISDAHLQKLAEELVENAFKFSKAGAPVRVTGRPDHNVYTWIVADNGRGMTAEQIADVGAYMQFGRKIHEQQGSGLGLTIAKRLAEIYGGELTVESVPGTRTTVRVILPA